MTLTSQLQAAMTQEQQLESSRLDLSSDLRPLVMPDDAEIVTMRKDLSELMQDIDRTLSSLLARSASPDDFRATFLHHRIAVVLSSISTDVLQQMLAVLADCSRLELPQLKRIGRKVAAVYTVMERDAVSCFGHVDAAVALPEFRVAAWLHELFDATRAAVQAAVGSSSPLLRDARYSLPAASTPSSTSSSPSLPHPGLNNSFSSPTTQQDITHHADTIPFPPGTYDLSAPWVAHLFIPTSLFPIPSRTRSATPESLIPSSSSVDATQHHDHDSQSPISLGRVAPSAEDLPSSQSNGSAGRHQAEVGGGLVDVGPPPPIGPARLRDAFQTISNRVTAGMMEVDAWERQQGMEVAHDEDQQLPDAVLARIEHLRALVHPITSSASISNRLRSDMDEMVVASACHCMMTDSEVMTAIAGMWVRGE